MKKSFKSILLDFTCFLAGGIIFSSAVTMFVSPNEISPGGITGIATSLNYLFSLPSGIVLFLLNIPILILGFAKFGGIFILKTAIATTIFSVSLTITDLLLPNFLIDKILAAIFGGILMGLGISLVMLRGATTGGIDIIAKLINRKFKHFTVGRIVLIIDALVIAFAAIAYKNIESILYSIISIYATSRIMDLVLYGADKGKLIYIITESPKEICNDINSRMQRGVTLLSAKGGYTSKERTVLLCTLRRYEVSLLYEIIDQYDKNAFVIVSDVGEILGEGFKNRY